MTLNDEDKKRIRAEEEERLKVRQEFSLNSWNSWSVFKRRHPRGFKVCVGAFVAFFIICFIIIISVSIGTGNKTGTTSADISYIEISAGQLYSDYQANEIAADQRYKGRALQVTGMVDSIAADILGKPYIVLKGNSNDWWGVQITYPDTSEYNNLLATVSKGQTLTVTGTCKGYLLNVLLEH